MGSMRAKKTQVVGISKAPKRKRYDVVHEGFHRIKTRLNNNHNESFPKFKMRNFDGVGTRNSKIFEGKPKNLASLCYQKDKIGSRLLGFKKLSIGKDTVGIAQTSNVGIKTLHAIRMCMSKTKMDRFQIKVKQT